MIQLFALRRIPRIKRSIKDVSSSLSTAKAGTIPNHILILRSPKRRCSGMGPSDGRGRFVAVWSAESLFRIILLRHSSGIMKELTRFSTASVSRRLIAVRITDVIGPFNIPSV